MFEMKFGMSMQIGELNFFSSYSYLKQMISRQVNQINLILRSIDIKHGHIYSKASKNVNVPKGQSGFTIDQQYADNISWATTSKIVKESVNTETPNIPTKKNNCK